MADTVRVSSRDDCIDEIGVNEDLYCDDADASELWDIWTERYENGADDDVLVAIPSWFADSEFGMERPFLFAEIEYDDDDKGAILFSNARIVDINVVTNGLWSSGDVSMSETLTVVDQTDDNEYIDETGKLWCPRSIMTIYERDDSPQTDFTDLSRPGQRERDHDTPL
jgi:hypothetical protein